MTGDTLFPLYLIVDPVGDRSARPTAYAVGELFRQCLAELRADRRAPWYRISLVVFQDGPARLLHQAAVAGLVAPDVATSRGRSYAEAFYRLNSWMTIDLAQRSWDGGEVGTPVLLVLSDADPADGDHWESEFRELARNHPDLIVRSVSHTAGRLSEGWLRHPAQRRDRLPDCFPDLAAAVRWAINGEASAAQPRQRDRPPRPVPAGPDPAGPARAEPEREWLGAFTPYSVGDPGAAPGKVRPAPDPTQWDRRDTVLDGVIIRDEGNRQALTVRAASVRGLSHRHYGTVRQDDYAFRCTDDRRYLIAVVSDGVSNSKLSHKAAALVCRVGSELVMMSLASKPPDELDWQGVVSTLSDEIVRLGHQVIERPPDRPELGYRDVAGQLAATALFAVLDLRPVGDQLLVYVCSVGDSSAWLLCDGQRWQPLQRVKNAGADLATPVTKALPARHPVPDVVRVGAHHGDVLVLMSDGIGDALQEGDGAVGRFLAEVWSAPPPPLQFAAQVDFARKTHDDDRTAIAIWIE